MEFLSILIDNVQNLWRDMSRRLTKLYLPSMVAFVKSFYNFSRISMKKTYFQSGYLLPI